MAFNPGVSGIGGASDVALNSLGNSEVLYYDTAVAKWRNVPIPQFPVRFSASTPSLGATGTDRAYAARTITSARMRCVTAPVGSSLSVQVQHSTTGASWTTIATLTISAGSTTEAVSGALSQAQAIGNLLRCNVTSIGSTTAATNVVVDVHYRLT